MAAHTQIDRPRPGNPVADRSRRGRARRSGFAAVLCVVAALAAACATSSDPGTGQSAGTVAQLGGGSTTVVRADEGTPVAGGKLAFGVDNEPDGFNPGSNQLASTGMLVASAFLEPVMMFDANRELKPYLAESMEQSDGAKTWTIKVKPNITFHDGTPLDAEAIKANIQNVKNGLGAIGLKAVDSMTATEPLTLVVKLNTPWSSFPSLLASSSGLIVSPKALEGGDAANHPVGTGPFVFEKWEHGSEISGKKFDKYRVAGKPYLDAIDFKTIPDPSTRASSLSSGTIDSMITDQVSTIIEYREKDGFTTVLDKTGDAVHVQFNQGAPPFDNENARKAVVLATDNAAVAETLGSGALQPIDQPFDDTSSYHQGDAKYPKHDLDAAKKAVEAYKKETGEDLSFKLMVFAGSTNLALSQILAEQWSAAGIKSEINSVEQASAIKDMLVGNFNAAMSYNYGFPDPDFNYIFWHSSYTGDIGTLSINFAHLKNKAIDAALDRGRTSLDPKVREEAYKEVVREMNQDSDYLWIYRYVQALIASDRVHGLKRAEETGFASIAAKPWAADLWIEQQ